MNDSIEYGGQNIEYDAKFTARKTLAISVHPNGKVEVLAPQGTSKIVIEERLRRRARWVLQQQRYFEQFQPRTPKRKYVGGETHLYLGRQYRLKIVEGEEEYVRLKGGYFWISVTNPTSPEEIAVLMARWYRYHAEAKLFERFHFVTARQGRLLRWRPALAIRPLQRRWGSYSKKGLITLNTDLVRAPLPCIDYVITHELAHARHPNHGKAFYDFLSQMMPDWEHHKTILERKLA